MFKKLNILIVSTSFSLVFTGPVAAEKAEEDFFTWTGITISGDLPTTNPNLKNFKYTLTAQGRFGDDSSRFSQALIRPGIGYAINKKTTIWLGYDWLPTSRPYALKSPFNEHRIWQQLLLEDKYSFGTAISRTRFEQRFFDIPGSTDISHRYRQMFKLSIPVPFASPNVSFVVWDEVFVNLQNALDAGVRSGFDQNWGFVGIGYRFNKHTVVETGYQNQYINRPHSPRKNQMNHILSINLFLNF
tara:strand:- start:522 stop:1253 length:732 start_codon:yes stop_codon:yes gene_type:complete